jgi:hypothetical protein
VAGALSTANLTLLDLAARTARSAAFAASALRLAMRAANVAFAASSWPSMRWSGTDDATIESTIQIQHALRQAHDLDTKNKNAKRNDEEQTAKIHFFSCSE